MRFGYNRPVNGIDGKRQLFQCPSCRKKFFFWRPDALPGAKVKCAYCGTDFEDEAAKRAPAAPPPAPAPAPAEPPAAEPAAS